MSLEAWLLLPLLHPVGVRINARPGNAAVVGRGRSVGRLVFVVGPNTFGASKGQG